MLVRPVINLFKFGVSVKDLTFFGNVFELFCQKVTSDMQQHLIYEHKQVIECAAFSGDCIIFWD